MDTGPMVQSPPSVASPVRPHHQGLPGGILDIGGTIQTGVGLQYPPAAGGRHHLSDWKPHPSLITGMGIGMAIGYVIILARKFTINQSNSHPAGAGRHDGGCGNSSAGFLSPLIILSLRHGRLPFPSGWAPCWVPCCFTSGRSPSRVAPFWGAMLDGTFFPSPWLIQGRLLGGIQEPVCAWLRKVVSKVKSSGRAKSVWIDVRTPTVTNTQSST